MNERGVLIALVGGGGGVRAATSDKYLLSTYCIPGTVQGPADGAVGKKAAEVPLGCAYVPEGAGK